MARTPQAPSNFITKSAETQTDLKRIRDAIQELINHVLGIDSGGLTETEADALYLKRAANDWAGFGSASPASTDRILLEQAASGFAKRYTPYSALVPGAFSIATDIAPLHWWNANTTAQSGGLVDSITDVGSSPKDFTQSGAARAPTAVDGNGNTYLALDGVADFYQAGVAADWAFMSNGTSSTIALVYHQTVAAGAQQTLLDTCNSSSLSNGAVLMMRYTGASNWGPAWATAHGVVGESASALQNLNPFLNKQVLVLRNEYGDAQGAGSPQGDNVPLQYDADLRLGGRLRSWDQRNSHVHASTASFPLTLGRRSSTAALFSPARIYEIIIDNKAWSDRQVIGFENYVRATYGLTSI